MQEPASGQMPPTVGRYHVLSRLATGGMAEIFLARLAGPSGFERPVVLKRVLPHLARDPEFVAMFLDEARLVAGIRHPNVVQVQDLVAEEGEVFLAMEYLEGGTALELLERVTASGQWFDAGLVAHIGAEACAGLQAAHELTDAQGKQVGLVHRDVSPANIFVTCDGAVKVLDFGVATAADRLANTATGQIKGKFSYLAPEQAEGHPVDRRTDLFALGAVLYELATGRPLFTRATEAATLRAVLDEPVLPPSRLVATLPAALDRVLLRALERDPAERYATAAAMRADLLAARATMAGSDAPAEALGALVQASCGERIAGERALLRGLRAPTAARTLPGRPRPRRRLMLPALVGAALLAGAAGTVVRFAGQRKPVTAAACSPGVRVSDLRAEWTTPNTIQWRWKVEGQPADLLRFELVVGPDAAEVSARAARPEEPVRSVRVWSDRERPELARLQIPRVSRLYQVDGTMTDGYPADTVQHARLAAIDGHQCRSVTDLAGARTGLTPFNGIPLVPATDGRRVRSRPDSFLPVTAGDAGTTVAYEYHSRCEAGRAACFENLKFNGVDQQLPALRAGTFAQAYVEATIACRGTDASFWSGIHLCFGTECREACADRCDRGCENRCDATTHWEYRRFAIACSEAGERRLQIPLRAFRASIEHHCQEGSAESVIGCPLTHERLGRQLGAIWISGLWPDEAVVRVDGVRLRW